MAPIRASVLVCLLGTLGCSVSEPQPTCSDSLRTLNVAVRGVGLSDVQRGCLEARLASADGVDRNVVSEILIWDARSDVAVWKRRVEHHVTNVEPDRLDYLVALARQAQRDGPGGAERSLRWVEAGRAAARRASPGADKDEAMHDLAKLNAIASEMLSPPDGAPETRKRTATAARAWYLLAKEQDKGTEWPLAMCANAGAPEDFCRGRADSF